MTPAAQPPAAPTREPAPAVRRVSFNGQLLATEAAHLQALLTSQGYELGAAFACAVNASFVPRPLWPTHLLNEGDRIDVIAPVTGG